MRAIDARREITARSGRTRVKRTGAVALAMTLVAGAVVMSVAYAGHPGASLAGSNFEIDTNANLKVDDSTPSIDWESVPDAAVADTDSGKSDESFGQGTKEDSADPKVVDGGIPPNKSDLKFFGVHQENTASKKFLHLFWSRVQDPSGTTNMDFEFNKLSPPDDGTPPARTAGDLLITYDLAGGGTNPTISMRAWTGSQWGSANPLGVKATGSINTTKILANESFGLGDQDPRTFGEASIDLSTVFDPNQCESFGSAFLKSRSSDSFTSALKDFVPPAAVNITNCGSVRITKTDDVEAPLTGATFTLYVDNLPVGGSRGNEDTVTTKTCTTTAAGICTILNVVQGPYWVVETVTPPNHITAADQPINVVSEEQTSLTFVNPRKPGAILVTKLRKHAALGSGDHPHAGVEFTVNGVKKTTDTNGQVCFDGLAFGDYTVTETTPSGYQGEAPKTVTVDNSATCTDNPYVGETVTFHNTPLSDITVSFNSQVPGGTASTISCTGLTADPADGTPDVFNDVSETFKNLVPGTYNCTVVIDP